MPNFKWSPEAIEAARAVLGAPCGPTAVAILALAAAVKVQPVVALPPCPTCGGHGRTNTSPMDRYSVPCPTCNGSGVERLVPVSEIVAFLNSGEFRGRHPS